MDVSPPPKPTHLRSGTPEYRRTSAVLFVAGFMAFAMLYVVQGILPDVTRDFSVSPAAASLTLSLTSLPLAVAVLVAASWSEGHGRRGLLIGAVLSAAALTLAASIAPSFEALLTLRVLTGLALAGLPAVAMAYVAEEFHPSGLGTAMGVYISGTGLGGMTGRLAGGLLAGVSSWRVAMAVVGGAVSPAATRFAHAAEAVRLANSVEYGLSNSVWSKNMDTVLNTAKALHSGTVYVNTTIHAPPDWVGPCCRYA